MSLKSSFSKLVVLAAAAGFSGASSSQDDALLASIKKTGEVKAAMGSAPPLLGISPNGKATGYMADITNLALKGMGLPELTPVLTGWSAMIPSLQAKHVDFVVPGMQANEARCTAALYSVPVFLQRQGLYVKAGNPKGITNAAQIASRPDIKLAVVPGGNPDIYAQQVGVKSEQIVRVSDDQAGASAVIGGRADAYMTGQFSIRNLKQQNLEVAVDQQMPFVIYGIVFRKEDVKFRDAISQQINILRANGKMRETMMKFASDAGIAEKDMAATFDTLSKIQRIGEVVPACE
jgi:polar amino acid transport system substrate-binding protein